MNTIYDDEIESVNFKTLKKTSTEIYEKVEEKPLVENKKMEKSESIEKTQQNLPK